MSRALLVILDGYGVAANPAVSAVDQAKTPFFDYLSQNFPKTTLTASGEAVGLPDGQFGNSEVGHLNIGAGRIVWQELSRINKAIRDGDFFENETLLKAVEKAKEKGYLHVMGLFSDGGVHSHNNHLFAVLELCKKHEIPEVYVHAFTDGRDTPPHSGLEYARAFTKKAKEIGVGTLASIIGRYYAMDRDNRWERVERCYKLLVEGEGIPFDSAEDAFSKSYAEGITDEFINPVLLDKSPQSRLKPGDPLLFYNIRGDRAREITRALTFEDFDAFNRKAFPDLHYVSFTQYDVTFRNVKVAYPPQVLSNTLGEVVSNNGLKQLRIAETEKYPHVTYFFNGGLEEPNEGEERILVASPKVATYDLQPEMSAPEVGDKLTAALKTGKFDLVVLNFANPDMVGHTGVFEAAVAAVEAVDKQLERVVNTAHENGYACLIIADHGNADCMYEEDGSPHTAHTTQPVPCILADSARKEVQLREGGILADVAPTLLKLIGIDQPQEMTGTPLY
ncbi:MAG: 2,3-bisphosphoglycerate-independent phosphoglycerate mutase [Balneolales bacterium]|nr:2,3-bisphosphoglycerate-independent phosphoglycerate mutase [Balneolales bacterium]